MGELVEHCVLVEILADLDLAVGRAEPTRVPVEVRREGLAHFQFAIDRPRCADELGQFGHTSIDEVGSEVGPLGVVRPTSQTELVARSGHHVAFAEGAVVARRHEQFELVGLGDVGGGVDHRVAFGGFDDVVAEGFDEESLGCNDAHGDLTAVADAERVERRVSRVDPRRVGAARREAGDVVGDGDVGGVTEEQVAGEVDIEDEVVDVVGHQSTLDPECRSIRGGGDSVDRPHGGR